MKESIKMINEQELLDSYKALSKASEQLSKLFVRVENVKLDAERDKNEYARLESDELIMSIVNTQLDLQKMMLRIKEMEGDKRCQEIN